MYYFDEWHQENVQSKRYEYKLVNGPQIKVNMDGSQSFLKKWNFNLPQTHPNRSKSTFFSKVGQQQLAPMTQSVKVDQPKQSIGVKEYRVDQFLQEAGFRSGQQPKRPAPASSSSLKSESRQEPVVPKEEIQKMMESMKAEIRKDVEQEMSQKYQQLKEEMVVASKSSEKDRLEQAIVEEYLSQMKIQKYQEYMQYLLSYYYNYDPPKYQQLLNEYHTRLEQHALKGLTEIQRKEMARLVSMTKEKVLQQNQQQELALFNQKRIFEQMNRQKLEHQHKQLQQKAQQAQKKQVPEHKFQFSRPQEVNPFHFRDDNEMGNEQEREIRDKYDLINPFANEDDIEQAYQNWDFEYIDEQERSKAKRLKELEKLRQKEAEEHDSFDSDRQHMEEELARVQEKLKQQNVKSQQHLPSQSKILSSVDEDKRSGFGDSALNFFEQGQPPVKSQQSIQPSKRQLTVIKTSSSKANI